MKEEPLISVIVPVYNVEKYLRRCLDSIVNQTYRNIEIILVDDGSTDDSGKICEEYAEKDKRITVIHKKNGGLSSARNAGMAKAEGEYAVFVDSDDEVKSDYVSYLFGLIKKYNTEISVATYSVVTESGKIIKNKKSVVRQTKKLTEEEALRNLLIENLFTVSANAKMYSKRLYKSIVFPVGKICEDNGTIYKFIMEAGDVAFGYKGIYNYYKNPGSIMLSKFNRKNFDLIELVDEACNNIVEKFSGLKDAATRRRILARFSLLRQIGLNKIGKEEKKKVREMKKYILKHKKDILTKDIYSLRDKIALLSLMVGRPFFSFMWKVYSLKRYS